MNSSVILYLGAQTVYKIVGDFTAAMA